MRPRTDRLGAARLRPRRRARSRDADASGALTTDAHKVYILPTRFGLLLAGALVLMLLVSVNYNNGLAHLFTFLLAGVAIVSMHYTQRNLVGIRFAAAPGKPVFAGDTARATVTLDEVLRRGRVAVWVRGGDGGTMVDIEAGGHAHAPLEFAAPRRGLQALPAVYLVSIYPLGLFCSWTRTLTGETAQLVYPRPAAPTPLPDTGSGTSATAGGGRRAGDADFSGLRPHRRGDPVSRVPWRASARGTGLMTKVFSGEGLGRIELRLADAPGSDNEARLGVLCRWVLDAEAAGFSYALSLPGVRIAHGKGDHHKQQCLRALALWDATP